MPHDTLSSFPVTTPPGIPRDRILHGNCVEVLAAMPARSIDLVVTDPPYLVNYRSRDGRTIAGDVTSEWLQPAFSQIYRVLKPDTFCISFYGWNSVEKFMLAWKQAGFRPVGHLVFAKRYASGRGPVLRQHEQAYLLAKGYPPYPELELPDVLGWEYTGNRLHPTQKPLRTIGQLVEAFSRPGDLVLDPFCGSGTTALAAKLSGRRWIGIEKDAEYHRIASARLEAAQPA